MPLEIILTVEVTNVASEVVKNAFSEVTKLGPELTNLASEVTNVSAEVTHLASEVMNINFEVTKSASGVAGVAVKNLSF